MEPELLDGDFWQAVQMNSRQSLLNSAYPKHEGIYNSTMDLHLKAIKSAIRRRLGAERVIYLGEQLRIWQGRVKSVTRYIRPGYWAGLEEYRLFAREGYRFVKISNPGRIGHLCPEVDALLKDSLMKGGDPSKLILVDHGHFANPHIVKYFALYFSVQGPSPVFKFVSSYGDPEGAVVETHPYIVAMYQSAKAYEVYGKWGKRPPLFELSKEDNQTLIDYLASLGMPADAWYICVHAREGGYSPEDESIHRYRSVPIASFSLAIEEIVRRGGWCIRMGDASMQSYKPSGQFVDYAHSAQKSPQLDIALAARCKFFLGSGSGFFNLAELFGRPCVVAHMSPLSCVYGFSPLDISIPQRLRDRHGNYLSLPDIMKSPCAVFRSAREFEAAGLKNVPNTPEDIRDVVVEMLDRLDGKAIYTEDDIRRQEEFRALFHEGHYAFGATSSIGRVFLRKYGG